MSFLCSLQALSVPLVVVSFVSLVVLVVSLDLQELFCPLHEASVPLAFFEALTFSALFYLGSFFGGFGCCFVSSACGAIESKSENCHESSANCVFCMLSSLNV